VNSSKENFRLSAIAAFARAKRLVQQTALVSKSASISLIEALPEGENVGYSSVVIEYTVPRQKGWAFRRWHTQLINTARPSEGFVRADRHRPLSCKDGV